MGSVPHFPQDSSEFEEKMLVKPHPRSRVSKLASFTPFPAGVPVGQKRRLSASICIPGIFVVGCSELTFKSFCIATMLLQACDSDLFPMHSYSTMTDQLYMHYAKVGASSPVSATQCTKFFANVRVHNQSNLESTESHHRSVAYRNPEFLSVRRNLKD